MPQASLSRFWEPHILYMPSYRSNTRYIGCRYPSIVFEVGWSESMPDLQHDKDLLLGGFDGQIKLAILINWPVNRNHMTVADKLEV
jgi:hypothetical protein